MVLFDADGSMRLDENVTGVELAVLVVADDHAVTHGSVARRTAGQQTNLGRRHAVSWPELHPSVRTVFSVGH